MFGFNLPFFCKLAIEKELLLKTTVRQREVEELQQVVTTLTLQLREKGKQNEELKKRLKGNQYYCMDNNNYHFLLHITLLLDIALMQKPLSDQGIEETQIKSSQEETSLTIGI